MKTIFFDLDGCLSNFVAGSFAFHGRSIPMSEVRWDFPQQIGFEGTWCPAFWDKLGYEFWLNLPRHEDGFEVFRWLESHVGPERIGLLSSPCATAGCRDAKHDWVKKHLPGYEKRLFLGSAKHLFAGPNKILVDDHDGNAVTFRAAGGVVVVPPRPWNERRAECLPCGSFDPSKVIEELREVLS